MRDSARIPRYCATLQDAWDEVPDWRFGQLIANFFRWLNAEKGVGDIFFLEDDKFFSYLEEYINH